MSKTTVNKRLEYLRKQIEKECINLNELCELQDLAEYIEAGATVLRQWAGISEFPDEPNGNAFAIVEIV